MFGGPDGQAFVAGPDPMSRRLELAPPGACSPLANSGHGLRSYGSAVAYGDGRILLAGGGDPPVAATQELHLDVVGVDLVTPGEEEPLVEVHEEPDLVERPLPVLRRERVHREPANAGGVRAPDRVHERLLTGGMAVGAGQTALLGPSPVAVHDNRHMARDIGRVQVAQLHTRTVPAGVWTPVPSHRSFTCESRRVSLATRSLDLLEHVDDAVAWANDFIARTSR